ncbi:helix-turn-helix domain-containing protein, partial [Streptomyces scabiei]|uniref:helix-turn-helix domain-containing protein n=1 Tax=Streptomyces scabiei TaxID=1930 RepID=UPI000A35D9F3
DLGLSQAELAERCGMKQPQISRFEAGGTVPTLPMLRRLARALGADLSISLIPHDE